MECAFQTLLHKIFLRILNYDELYIDYGTYGHPNENLSNCIITNPPTFAQKIQRAKDTIFDIFSSKLYHITGGRIRL